MASEFVRTSSPRRSETPRQRAAELAAGEQLVRAQRAGRDHDAARGLHAPVAAQPGAGALAGDLVALRAVGRAERFDVHDRALGLDRRARALGQPEVVLDQRVLGVVRAADHAAPAQHAAGPLRPGAAEERVRDGLAGRAEEHADARLGVGPVGADLAPELAQQLVGGIVGLDGDHAEHPLCLVVVGRKCRLPVVQARPLRIGVEARRGAVERVRVTERAAAHARAARHRDVLEDRQAEDALHPELRCPEVAPQVPRGTRQLVVGEPPAGLQHADPVALLGQAQRGHASAEARPNDDPVVVVHPSRG
jgi:hypothetical protein